MLNISQSVGNGGKNIPADVLIIQKLLNMNLWQMIPYLALKEDRKCGPITVGMIKEFQKRVMGMNNPDGRVDPGKGTIESLNNHKSKSSDTPSAKTGFNSSLFQAQAILGTTVSKTLDPQNEKKTTLLTEQDYEKAARIIGVETAAVKAVASVESRGSGFLSNGKPKILFEGHYFSRFTKNAYDTKHPTISYKKWTKVHYKGGAAEYDRYCVAYSLDKEAAMKSASWGKFQIMGANYSLAGYSSVEKFVSDMYLAESYHLNAFVRYLKSTKLDAHLKTKNWAKFAEGYNGPGYKENKYDVLMKQAYEAFCTGPTK